MRGLKMFRLSSNLLRTLQRNCRQSLIKEKSTKASIAHEQQQQQQESTAGAVEQSCDETAEATTVDETQKNPTREPLARNFFVGIVDKELLGYPEVIARDEMAELQNQVLPIKDYFKENVDNYTIESTRTVPPIVLDNLKQLGLYSFNVPRKYEGKGYGWSESLIASQPETECTSLALGLQSHRVIVDILRELGTAEQQQRFLTRLATGELVGVEAIYEYIAPEDDFFNTNANYDGETSRWILNGEKSYVITGPLPKDSRQLFLVIAQTQRSVKTGRCTTIFLVDSANAGVKLADEHVTFGCRAAQMRTVKFEDVQLDDGCVIGQEHNGNTYAQLLSRASRLRNALVGLTMSKNLVKEVADYSINQYQCGRLLKDMDMVRLQVARATTSTYAIESMIFLTAGLLDEFVAQDVTLEAAMTKYFTLKQLYEIATSNLNLIGPKSLHAGQASEVVFRNAAQLYTQGETIDMLGMFIAMSGLQHAGVSMNTAIHKARNPLFYPGHIFNKFLESSSIETPKTKMLLGDNLHPSLESGALYIEHSVARLHMSVELLFTRHGPAVVERHSEMERLADISTTIYAMFASIARASRSYCIGLPLADNEMLAASAICTNGHNVVKELCMDILNGQYINNDHNLLRLSSQAFKSKGYFAEHPLNYNF